MATNWIDIGVKKGYLLIEESIVQYIYRGKSYHFTDPEEKIRASLFVELIEKYGYEEKYIDIEVSVPRRTPKDFADMVIFRDEENKQPYIVIECKKEGISDLEFSQAIEQCFGNSNSLSAEYNLITAGNTRRSHEVKGYKSLERIDNIIADIPVHFGQVQEWRFRKGDPDWDLQTIEKIDLIRILEKCHDTLWQGGKLAPTVAFDELCKIIFVKVRDEKTPRKNKDPYAFQIKTHEKPFDVKDRIDNIYKEAMEKDPEVFSEEIKVGPKQLFSVVNHLQSINLNKTDLDVKGVAFERFMEDFFKGKNGQYFTPREVVSFMVKMTNPDHESKTLDPACGSGGFLLNSLDYIRNQADKYFEKDSNEHYNFWHDYAKNYLYGIEINDSISRVSKMNMILHDDGHTNVIGADALKGFKDLIAQNEKFKKETFDIILTNPPFGATIRKEETSYYEQYILGEGKTSQKTEILFIERCFEFLKWGSGVLAIVLPNGILSNATMTYVREFILDRFKILANIGLPASAFTHYGAGVESSLLFMTKHTKKEYNKIKMKKIALDNNNKNILNTRINEIKSNMKKELTYGSPSQQQVTEEYAPRFKILLEAIDECLIILGKKPSQKINNSIKRFSREINDSDYSAKKKITTKEKQTYTNRLTQLFQDYKELETLYKIEFNSAVDEGWLSTLKETSRNDIEQAKLEYKQINDREFKEWLSHHDDYPIFCSRPTKIGYDATGRKCENELDIVISMYNEFLSHLKNNTLNSVLGEFGEFKDTKGSYVIFRSKLVDRLDTYYYQPIYQRLEKFLYHNYQILTLDEIGEVFDGPFGSNLKNDEYVDDGIPLFRVQNIKDGEVAFDKKNTVFITLDKHAELIRSEVIPGNVVITKTGWLGNAAVVPNTIPMANIRADLAGVRLHRNSPITPEFLAVFIDSAIGKRLCSRLTSGSTRDRMVISNVKKIPIPILDPIDQTKIVSEVKKKLQEANELKQKAEKILLDSHEMTEAMIVDLSNISNK